MYHGGLVGRAAGRQAKGGPGSALAAATAATGAGPSADAHAVVSAWPCSGASGAGTDGCTRSNKFERNSLW